MPKKGYTLIELVVAMGIFIIAITLVVGAFATVSRMKALTHAMKETQQKTRIALETITRLARQSEKLVTPGLDTNNKSKVVEMYFDVKNNPLAIKFAIENSELNRYHCVAEISPDDLTCSVWEKDANLLGGGVKLDEEQSSFEKVGSIPPLLNISLHNKIDNSDPYYSDSVNIETAVILENLK